MPPFNKIAAGLAFMLANAITLHSPALAEQAIFGFAGALTNADMQNSANPLGVDYEPYPVLGVGYQKFTHQWRDVSFGLEAGAAGRFGGKGSAELWGGGVVRYDSIALGNTLNLSPAFTAGLSAVSRTHSGREQKLEDRYNGNAKLLFYLGPEINLSFQNEPKTELFWRLHHRSGAGRTLGNMKGAANANVIGIRHRF